MTGDAQVLVARSPLAGWTLSADGVRGRELALLGQLNVRSRSGVAPVPSAGRVLRLGPDEWLVLTDPDADLAGVASGLAAAGSVVTDVSAQRTTIELRGPRVRDLLARGCAIDLDPAVRPLGTCVETLLAQAGVILLVESVGSSDGVPSGDDAPGDDSPGDEDVVWVLVRPSYASYLARWLEDASTDLT